LEDRVLSAWAQPDRVLTPGRRAYRDLVQSVIDVPVETPPSALHTFVNAATKPLFEAFDGFRLDPRVLEDLVTRLFNRRLS
jgi:hypothetical protein